MPTYYQSVYDLIYAVINELGLSIDPIDNTLIDQDTKNKILSGGKTIKCSVDPNYPVYNSITNIVFDPLNNIRLMTFFLGYYFEKEASLGEFYVVTYNFQDNKKRGPENMSNIRVRLQISPTETETIESEYYYNRCLKICDIILRLAGYAPNLKNFDKVMDENAI